MRRFRGIALVAGLVVLVAVVLVLVGQRSGEPLDPANPDRGGAEAVASVLEQQGVRVRAVDSPSALDAAAPGTGSAILVSRPDQLSDARLTALLHDHAGVDRVVLVAPRATQLNAVLGSRITDAEASVEGGDTCRLGWGHDLRFEARGRWYDDLPDDALTCFGRATTAPVFELPPASGRPAVLVIGSTAVLDNATVAHGDNAAIALRSLGHSSELVWYSGGLDPQATPPSVAPRWVVPAVWLLASSVVLLMLWRGRRLGKLVTEPLPVVVPANETTRARGQLYRKSRDSAAVAGTLRAGTRVRLAGTLGLAPRTPTERLVDEVARATGRRPDDVARLLVDGVADVDSRSLPDYARELTALERQARRS